MGLKLCLKLTLHEDNTLTIVYLNMWNIVGTNKKFQQTTKILEVINVKNENNM